MERLVQEIAEQNLDRETARAIPARAALPVPPAPSRGHGQLQDQALSAVPLQGSFRATADAPVHLSLSLRQPDVSREQVISTLEGLLAQLRSGELDARLRGRRHR